MRIFESEAILLDVADLHEQDRVVSFLTREHGRKRGVARGSRRKYSRFAGQLQPLAKVRIAWFEKDGRDLGRIREVELLRSSHRLRDSLDDILLGSYLTEHLMEFAQENEPSEAYFRLLDATTEALLDGVRRDLVARYFETWVLRLAGIFPVPRECPECGRDLAAGGVLAAGGDAVVCGDCGSPGGGAPRLEVGPAVVSFLRRSGRESVREIASSKPPDALVLERVEGLCGRIRRVFLQHELRSCAVLERVRAEVGSGTA